MKSAQKPLEALIVAIPETSGSALYGMLDVLSMTGSIWQTLSGSGGEQKLINPRIVSLTTEHFNCGNGVPVQPELDIHSADKADIVILSEIWLGPDEDFSGRYPELIDWIRSKYNEGTYIYSACSGSVMLAETGLLDGCDATSHWGFKDLFHKYYPKINFKPEPNIAFADPKGRIVTAGGTTSWHDLAIHIITRHCNPGEAMNIAKVYLLKWHSEGQLPYTTLIRRNPHADAVVRACEDWLSNNFSKKNCIAHIVETAELPERTLKRRFKSATGSSLIEYIQNLRIEEAKRLLESENTPVDDISVSVGYEDPSFFRRLFKRGTGLTPSQYRKMFQPVLLQGSNG
jgi:transcriptional regulator GlxA family with amidase domain